MKDVHSLIETGDIPSSLTYWCDLLWFFERFKDDLDISEVRLIAKECERCRVHWNSTRVEVVTVQKNGKPHQVELRKQGLGIAKEDTNPNIYAYLAEMERQEEENQLEEEKKQMVTVKSDPEIIPLAAAPA